MRSPASITLRSTSVCLPPLSVHIKCNSHHYLCPFSASFHVHRATKGAHEHEIFSIFLFLLPLPCMHTSRGCEKIRDQDHTTGTCGHDSVSSPRHIDPSLQHTSTAMMTMHARDRKGQCGQR